MAAKNNLPITITAVDRTKKAFSSVTKSLNFVRRSLLNFKTAIVGVAGAAGLGLLIKSSLDSIDTLGKTAQKLGVTSQALQKLRYASNLAGVETRTVDMAVQRFTRRLSEAANGTGEAKDALKELGLNAKELGKQPLDKQMLALADAFDEVQSSGDKVRLAFKLFDSEGVAFVNTLQGGSAALKEMFKEAEGLGFVLSSSAVAGVEQANDAVMKLSSMLGGVRDQIVAGLAPALTFIADIIRKKLVDAIQGEDGLGNIEDFARKVALAAIDLMEKTTKGAVRFANTIIRSINNVILSARVMASIFRADIGKSLEDFEKISEQLGATLFSDLRAAIIAADDVTKKYNNTNDEGVAKVKTYADALKDLKEAAEKVKEGLGDAAVRGVKSLEDALVDVTMGAASAKDAFKSMARSIISDLIRIQIQQSITQPLAEAMTGGNFLSTIGSALFGGKKAIGGSVRANTPYMVGERGAEMFVPNSSGSIVPNNKLGGGGVVVNQTINLSAGVSQTVRAEVMGMLPQIQEASKAAVLDARRRGGGFASAFGG